MADLLASCLAVVSAVTLYQPLPQDQVPKAYQEKCKAQNCYVVTNSEFVTALTQAHKAGRNRTLNDLNRGDIANKLTTLEKDLEQCKTNQSK